jgi:hypothetical protein
MNRTGLLGLATAAVLLFMAAAQLKFDAVSPIVAATSIDGVTGLPADITSLLSMAGIWQPIADRDVTSNNHGEIANTFVGNIRIPNGLEGLVISGWSFAGFSNTVATVTPVTIAMLEQQSDGTLQLATAKYVADASTNGAGSVVVADFNQDGVQDAFFPAWNEDPNIPASSTAFLSSGGTYTKVSVADFIEAHGSNLAVINGLPTVFTAGYYNVPGHGDTVYQYDGVNNFKVIADTGAIGNSSVAVADFYGTGTYSIAYGDFTFGPNYPFDSTKLRGIYVYNMIDFKPTGRPFNVGMPYFDGKPQYSQYPSFWDPQKTHTFRLWVDDFNQDGKQDLVSEAMIWISSLGPQKNILQMFQNDGNFAFRDVTDALNPDYDENCYQQEYQPLMRDVDSSGIKSYFFASTNYSLNDGTQPPCNYVLVNDGTGRFHVALHDTLNRYGQQILSWLRNHLPSGYSAGSTPRLRAYQVPNGLINFVAIVKVAFGSSNAYVARYVFVNLPLQLDLQRQFTQPINVADLNGSHRIRTFAGDDSIYAMHVSGASIDGGLGTNAVAYVGPSTNYSVTRNADDSTTVTEAGSSGADTLIRIQEIRFSDQAILSSRAFALMDRAATSLTTTGGGSSTTVGYARIEPDSGSATPSGVAIFGLRQNGTLVSEVGVPATGTLTSGRIYAEFSGAVDAGVAIANPNATAATISFYFTDATGNFAGSGTMTIPANQQISQFLDQAPFNVYATSTFLGTFSFTSSVPVAVVALRGFTNERGDFLMSTLPVIDNTIAPNSGTTVIPHFADGGGWTTQVLLVNSIDNAMAGAIQFLDPNGKAVNVTIGGQTGNTFPYSVAGRTSQKFVTSGTAAATVSGSIQIVPTGIGPGPTPLVLFSYRPAAVTVSVAGVPVISGTAFRMYVESSGQSGQSSSIQSGLAVATASSSSATVTFDLTDLTGSGISGISPVSITLPAAGQAAKFLSDIFPSLPNPFKGVLRMTTTSAAASVVGLRTRVNERGDFLITTTPPSVETAPTRTGPLFFPEIVDGGGYTTQFILFSGTTGGSANGTVTFTKQDGTSFILTLQ